MSAVFAALVLVLVYGLALPSFAPWDLAIGLAVSVAVLGGASRLLFPGAKGSDPPPLWRRVAGFPLLSLAVAREVAAGTWQVALVVLRLRPLRTPGIVAVPVGERTPAGVAATALAVTLSPGEVFVDLDEEQGAMLVHVLDASDPEAVRRRYDAFYRRYQRRVFP